jgi:signal peptidase I
MAVSAATRAISNPFRLGTHRRLVTITSGALAVVFVAMSVLVAATFVIQLRRVDGASMQPTLNDHDLVLVDRLAYELGTPQPGDIVTLYYPFDPDRVFVKRVIAVDGQSVEIVDGQVFVDGAAVQDDYVGPTFRSHDNWGPELVSSGHCFVLGDHRNMSSDSREWGLVPRKYVIGKVALRWSPLVHLTLF